MKKTSRIIAVIISLVMIIGLCACSAEDKTYKQIEGEWRCEINVTETMAEELESELGVDSIDSGDIELIFPLVLTFEDDKTFHFEYDQDDLTDSFEGYLDWLCEWMIDYMMDMMVEQTGFSEDEINEFFESEYGVTLSEYVETLMDESIDLESLFDDSEMEIDGYYKLENDKLYLAESSDDFDDDNYLTYTIEDDTLIIEDVDGDLGTFWEDIDEFVDFPLEFDKE